MKTCMCVLALIISVQAGLVARHVDDHHHTDVHHSDGVQMGHSLAIGIGSINDNHHHDFSAHYQTHPVYQQHRHDVHDNVNDNVHHNILDDHHAAAAEIIHHEAVHHIEPAHVTKIVHHEPHHYLHYHHIDEHHHAAHGQANIRHIDLHTHDEIHHPNIALLHKIPHSLHPYEYYGHGASVHYAHPTHFNLHSLTDLLSFAKHQLSGHYGKVRITEKYY